MKISRQTREAINIVIFIVVAGLLLTFYVIYPLNRAKALMGRTDLDDFAHDSIPPIDPTVLVEAGLPVDTFRVEADGLTQLGCYRLIPTLDSTAETDSIRGTVLLIPSQTRDLATLLPLTRALLDSGFAVTLYDQRATGSSTGRYHGEGQYEAADLQALIGYMYIHEQVVDPLHLVGFATGGDAALLIQNEESRPADVIAVRPYLSSTRWLDKLKEKHGTIGIPFFRTVMWFWYEIRSGYAAEYRDREDVRGVELPTLVLLPADDLQSEEAELLKAESPDDLLRLESVSGEEDALLRTIIAYIISNRQATTSE